ncbi:MAG: arginase family protein [Nannocystaceae bacterium]
MQAMQLPQPPAPHSLRFSEIVDELALYLRPPGMGIHAVSTGRDAVLEAAQHYLGAAWSPELPWRASIERQLDQLRNLPAATPRVAIVALPSDTGCGIVRGASWGPAAIRERLGHARVPDFGDVFTVPQLLADDMHAPAQIAETQDAIYPHLPLEQRRALPVSPVSCTARVYDLLLTACPGLRPMLLGGDHTVTWPALHILLRHMGPLDDVGVVHFDAHTDLLAHRLGVKICFATWAYHINEQLGRGQRMVQIGIRASGFPREHWESTLDVRQIWAHTAQTLGPKKLAHTISSHLREKGLRRIYVTHDIDGTDAYWAAACGTPEANGLTPAMVLAVLDQLAGDGFDVVGADVVEVAPGLSLDAQAARRTCITATAYTQASLDLLTGSPTPTLEARAAMADIGLEHPSSDKGL